MACRLPTQSLAKIFAYFEIALSVFNCIALSFNACLIIFSPTILCQIVQSDQDTYKVFAKFLQLTPTTQLVTFVFLLFLCVCGLCLGLQLLRASNTRNGSQLKKWRLITSILYLLCLPIYIIWLIYCEDVVTLVVSFVVIYFVAGFSFYIVHVLIFEIEIQNAENLNNNN